MTKGGSQASSQVVQFVTPAAFDKLNKMFTNKVSLTGGNKRSIAINPIDINEVSGHKMMVYHSNGGKKKPVKKAVKPVAKKPVKKTNLKVKKGGDGTCTGSMALPGDLGNQGSGFDTLDNLFKAPDTTMPPTSGPTHTSSFSYKAIPPTQQLLRTQEIATMNPINKWTAFPPLDAYQGAFSFGGAKKKVSKPKAKKVVKPAKKASDTKGKKK